MEVLLIILGAVLVLVGIVGCFLPVLPGPPLSFAGLFLLWVARDFSAESFGPWTVGLTAAATVAVTVLDLVAPAVGAQRFGASRLGFWGSVIGMLVGILGIFPLGPFGMVIGAFLGALVGELLAGKEGGPALRAAWGVFVGTMVGILLKLIVSGAIAVYFVIEVFS